MQRFFKTGPGEYGEGDIFIGVTVPNVRRTDRRYYADTSLEDKLKLLRSGIHEERLLALIMLVLKYAKEDTSGKERIYKFYLRNTAFINNWDLVDLTAHHIVGAYLEDKDRGPLYKLARSKSLWERRISILATFHYIRNREYNDTLAIAGTLVNDRHDLIHKAVGWMLREVGNRDKAREEVFLKKYYKTMPRTMLRYAIEKFTEAERKRYLKGQVRV